MDHVPPKNLFLKPRPSLITVPACRECNSEASLDDEYFRSVIVARADTDGNVVAEQLRRVVLRSFDRSDGWRTGWFSRTRLVDIVDDFGQRDSKMQYQMDYDRLSKVADRTIRGLHFDKFGSALPVDCPILVMQDWALDDEHKSPESKIGRFIANFDDTPAHTVHPDVFAYKRENVVGEDLTAAWLLWFFNRVWIIGLVNVATPSGFAETAR